MCSPEQSDVLDGEYYYSDLFLGSGGYVSPNTCDVFSYWIFQELVNAHYNSLTTHELCHQNIFLKHMTASQLNPSYECGEGMKVKVVKWC